MESPRFFKLKYDRMCAIVAHHYRDAIEEYFRKLANEENSDDDK